MPPSRPASAFGYHPDHGALSRPSSSASLRTPYNELARPASSASSYRPSSLATSRPLSSASMRPTSRAAHRAPSRLSQRPPSRQASRLAVLSHTLVSQVTHIDPNDDEEEYRDLTEMVSRGTDYNAKAAPSSSMRDISKLIHGRAQRARITSQDAWADAVELALSLLKSQVEKINDLDSEITMSLSVPPTPSTEEKAEEYLERIKNPPVEAEAINWRNILDEEPFEGQHWEGVYGLPPGSTVEGWEARSLDSTPPYSPLPLDDLSDFSHSISSLDSLSPAEPQRPVRDLDVVPDHPIPVPTYSHRELVEELRSRQYWRSEWQTDASITRSFTIEDASSLGPSLNRLSDEGGSVKLDSHRDRYIHEHDAVREILMGFQGYKNSFLTWSRSSSGRFSFEPSPDTPRVLHFSPASQLSIVRSFAQTASTVEHLRRFVACVSGGTVQSKQLASRSSRIPDRSRRVTKTVEAFTEAVEIQIGRFNVWCADKERDIILSLAGNGPPLTVSFLSLEKTVRDSFSFIFDTLLDVLREVMGKASRAQDKNMEVWMLVDLPSRFSPFTVATSLLDTLLVAADNSSSNGDVGTSRALMRVFTASAEPMWAMVGSWLKHGVPTQDPSLREEAEGFAVLDDEFFVQDNGLPVVDPDFWTEGFTSREATSSAYASESAPLLLDLIISHIVRAGKAVGLLRVLDLPLISNFEPERAWMSSWPTFSALLGGQLAGAIVETSKEQLSRFVYDAILPYCHLPQKRLAQVIASECDFWLHLTAMEDLFFMRRGEAMSHLSDVLFSKMNTQQSWTDFHFMNTSFRDTVTIYSNEWIDPTLVRLSYSGSRQKASRRTVDALEDLFVEYSAPFPLTYLFSSDASKIYRSILIFLLQIRRAKGALERAHTWDVGTNATLAGRVSRKVIFVMRSKLLWFINTLFNFVVTHVLHKQLLSFHAALKPAESLDEIIILHDAHLQKVQSECLLQGDTTALHEGIISVLDMAINFSDALAASEGQTTSVVAPLSKGGTRLHRSRREKWTGRNAIGFVSALREAAQTSESESDLDEEEALRLGSLTGIHHVDLTFQNNDELHRSVHVMQDNLDDLVQFIRREVEELAGGTSGSAQAFSIFAFALEDWDR
ncbi:Spc98 family-domain-containing protein [Gloeopeniophorella convolvens]|nr:Spc98 family-domain-containing protein [Gloeopeniophorella convolvens]